MSISIKGLREKDRLNDDELERLLDVVERARAYAGLFYDHERAGLTELKNALSHFTD